VGKSKVVKSVLGEGFSTQEKIDTFVRIDSDPRF